MLITNIEAVTKTKNHVFIDEVFAFTLSASELLSYSLAVGQSIPEDVYQDIKTNVVLKKAKLKAMQLLSVMSRTEKELGEKLRQNHYTQDIIDQAIAYVKSFGYVNDQEYIRHYILSREGTKSRKELYAGLYKKHLSKEMIEQGLLEHYGAGQEREAIRALMCKRGFDPECTDDKQRQKLFAYLARKGFQYDDIRSAVMSFTE